MSAVIAMHRAANIVTSLTDEGWIPVKFVFQC